MRSRSSAFAAMRPLPLPDGIADTAGIPRAPLHPAPERTPHSPAAAAAKDIQAGNKYRWIEPRIRTAHSYTLRAPLLPATALHPLRVENWLPCSKNTPHQPPGTIRFLRAKRFTNPPCPFQLFYLRCPSSFAKSPAPL